MNHPDLRSISEIAPLIRAGAISVVDLVSASLAQIRTRASLNAIITVLEDTAREDARRLDTEIRSGRWRGPLHGIPIAVKDLVDVAGTRTTAGSAIPTAAAAVDAPVTTRLRDAGAILVAKTNLHEFAFGTTSDESAFGPVRHPQDESRSAGGSSGGSAAALATGMCFGALGTDTGGSIRIPSAVCGTVGLKPSLGEVSLEGVLPLSTTLDHIGPMTRSVQDAALMFEAMAGPSNAPAAPAEGSLRFGVLRPYFCDRLDSGVREALDEACTQLARAGHEVLEAAVEHADITADVYLHIVLPEAAWYHGPLLDRSAGQYSPGVRIRLEMGRYVLAEDYVRAMHLRDELRRQVDRALEDVDALLLPSLAIPAPLLGASTVAVGGHQEPVRALMLRLTQLFNITGHPALALPGKPGADGLPRGLQLVGKARQTRRLLSVGMAVERQISGGAGSVGGGTG
ncbi:MAG TPA: amidase [Vicinamibacterales bacterium]|nr:amidase [Vicinamibacterales bacterium]